MVLSIGIKEVLILVFCVSPYMCNTHLKKPMKLLPEKTPEIPSRGLFSLARFAVFIKSSIISVSFLVIAIFLSMQPTLASSATGGFPFYAVYDRVADFQSLNLEEIYNSLLSADGKRVVVYGRSRRTANLALFTLNADGSNIEEIQLPEVLNGIREAAINNDGSRVFFLHSWSNALFKMEAGQMSRVFDAADYSQVTGMDQIQTTADGEWVYFREPRHSIWRVNHRGGVPSRLFQEKQFKRDGGIPANIGLFRISADGTTLVFTILGYWDGRGVHHTKHEVFILKDGSIRQLTNDPRNIFKERLSLSGDGRVVAYASSRPQNKMWSIRTDGSQHRALEGIVNVGLIALNHDGSRLYYYDQANGGRLAYTDGSGGIDLFPRYNVRAIALQAPWSLAVSDTGDRICFRFHDGVYMGHIGFAHAVADAPVIKEIQLHPPITNTELARQGTTLRAYIDDPQGVEDIIRTQTNELVSGTTNKSDQNVPVFFSYPMNDAGAPPDQKKGDGVFSSGARPGRKPEEFNQTHVRVAVMDKSFNVTVADATLTGGKLGAVAVDQTARGLENNTNRPGSDFHSFTLGSADPELCRQACEKDPRCVAFTYVKPGLQGKSARCWLKDSVPDSVPDNCCVSGVKGTTKYVKDSETKETETDISIVESGPSGLSSSQEEITDLLGPPNLFKIAYLPLGEQGKHLVRYETWTYSEHSQEITFIGGEILSTRDIQRIADTDEKITYIALRPESFDLQMNLSQVTKIIGSSDFERVESLIDGFEEEGIEIYQGENCIFYIQDGYLLYFETFATGGSE